MKVDLTKKFPQKIFNIIKIVGDTADRENYAIFIVGGPVRDMLLNMTNYDLDFVLEGDAVEFSNILNKTLKGTLKIYKAFKTATIRYKGMRIDIVTARKESYKRPAAYPDVVHGTIKDDLFRRDFTINAMAVSVNKKNPGELVDFYGGYKDLGRGVIRVMHDKSFIDDPTRIFRAVRFAARFDFQIESDTKRLMKEAIMGGFLGKVNRGRIRKEVELFLKEKDPAKCLASFSNLI